MTKKNITSCIKALLIISLVILVISIILLSLVPPVSRDALVHHLAVPKLYLKHGGIYEIPFMDFSYYPMNLDLLYMIPLYLGSDIAPKFIHFAFGLLTGWLIFYYLRRRINTGYALGGALFFLSIPVIVKLSTTVYVDLGEIFFSFAALLLILKWLNSGFKWRVLVYSGIMCGLALGTKYNGLVTLIILTFFVPFLSSRYGAKEGSRVIRSVKHGAIFLIVSLVVFSPWMIRDYHWKNNPVYPLYNGLFNPQKNISNHQGSGGIDEEAVEMSTGIFTYRSIVYNETGWEIALLPVRIFFQGKDNDPKYFDGRLNPFLLVLTLFAFYRSRDEDKGLRREKKIMLFFSILVFVFAFFAVSLRIRYISTFIPPLTVLSVFGFVNLVKLARRMSSLHLKKFYTLLLILIPVCAFALNAVYLKGLFGYVNPIPFIIGEVSRDEYIEEYIPEYPALTYINH